MRLTSWITLNYAEWPKAMTWLLMVSSLSGCSVYQSQGRKQFDTYAPGRTVRTDVGISSIDKKIASQDCWTQPLNQRPWNHPSGTTLIVQDYNDLEITYCVGRLNETVTQ